MSGYNVIDPILTSDIDTKNLTIRDDITVATDATQANASQTVTISNVAPAGVGTATITKWLKVINGGVTYYIPMWT